MEHIGIFNREVAGLISNQPMNERLQAIEKYRQGLRAGMDYHGSLIHLGVQLGLELGTEEVFRNGKSQGHIPMVILREGNPYNGKQGVRKFTEYPRPSLPNLYDYMARQYVYFLIDVKRFAEHALGAKAQ